MSEVKAGEEDGLVVQGLTAWYGAQQVLRGVDFGVRPGEVVALLGRNGSGRSTTARALMGLVACSGQVRWQGRSLVGLKAHEVARLGVGYVPEGREVFATLSVRQNLLLGLKPQRWGRVEVARVEEGLAMFPELKRRADVAAGRLSGGEQQLLALARMLMGRPRLAIVDEPTEGLSPQRVQQVRTVLQGLREQGVGVLLIEQKLALALELAQRVLVMGRGRVVFSGTPAQLEANPAVRREWLEV